MEMCSNRDFRVYAFLLFYGVRIEFLDPQCIHYKTIEMHICMKMKQLDWCIHCGQEIPKQVYALSWCKPVIWLRTNVEIPVVFIIQTCFSCFSTNNEHVVLV